jgi:hypothetical protein
MSDAIKVFKNRTNLLPISIGFDVSDDVITSEIRTPSGELIATWTVLFDSDGTDGEIVLKLDDAITEDIQYPTGIMDIKRVSGGEPYAVFDGPLEVTFIETVTA